MYLLITYDISSNKQRNKIDKILSSYGDRVNYSVFEIKIKKHDMKKLIAKLKKLMDKDDSIRIYQLTYDAIQSALELNKNRNKPFESATSYV